MDTATRGSLFDLPSDRLIDRGIYYEPAVFAEEIEKIFKKTWQFVGHESELAAIGDYLTVDIYDQRLIVTRAKDGALRAFYNNCTHRGAALATETKGNCGNAFRCMYHGWSFDLEGRLTGLPRRSSYGPGVDLSMYNIPQVRVESFAKFIFVCLDSAAPDLETFLGGVKAPLLETSADVQVLGRLSFFYPGNWKLWSDNARDGYHAEYTHPLVGAVYRDVAESAGTIQHFAKGHSKLWWPIEGDPRNIGQLQEKILGVTGAQHNSPGTRPMPPVKIDFARGNVIAAIFPNVHLQWLMAGSEHVMEIARPIGPKQTRVDMIAFAPADESPEGIAFRLAKTMDSHSSAGKVTGDDCEAVTRITEAVHADGVQWTPLNRGLKEGDLGHKTDDTALRGFYAAWRDHMGVGS